MAQGPTQQLATFPLQRTERAFRMDAEHVMGSDPTRAIVELVTNADDAYLSQGSSRKGSIRIEVERRRKGNPTLITVKDRAGGMTCEQMKERLGREGSRTSGFERNLDVRGLLGRGAKDCRAFGKVRWESVTPRERAVLELQPSGWCTPQRAVAKARKRESGTTATVTVEPRFTVKNHENLREALTRHYELRPCLLDRERREVRLVDPNQHRDDHLVYEPPRGTLLEDCALPIPGYPGETMQVRLFRAGQNLDDGWEREYWRHGLVVTSGRAAYDIFAGTFDREPWSHYYGYLFGEAHIPAIRTLIREYDDREEKELGPLPTNPCRLLSRDRRGLVPKAEHPFVEALHDTLEQFLQPHLEGIRKELEASEESLGLTDDTRRRLRELGKLVGRLLEEEEQPISTGINGGTPAGLCVIPTAQEIEPGKRAHFSVQWRPPGSVDNSDGLPVATLAVGEGPGSVSPEQLELLNRGGYFSRSFIVEGLSEGDLTEVVVELCDYKQNCLVQCLRPDPPPTVSHLQFEHATYRVRDGARRHVIVLAPWELVAEGSAELQVSVTGDGSISRRPGDLHFGYDDDRQCGVAAVVVHGRGVGSKARLRASLGGQEATADIYVASEGAGGVEIKFDDKEDFHQRAVWDGNILKIYTLDKSVARYLGPGPDWRGQHSVHFRTMLAEIVTFHVVRKVIENKHPGRVEDGAYSLYREHLKLEQKWSPRIHGVLIGTADLQ